MNDIRKACVRAVSDALAEHGDVIRPAVGDEWDGIDASRPLGHIVGYIDLDVTDLVDLIIDTINKEL